MHGLTTRRYRTHMVMLVCIAGILMVVPGLLMTMSLSALADTESKSFEGIWRSPRSIVAIRQATKGYTAKGCDIGGRPAADRKPSTPHWVSWGTSPLVANALTYKFTSPTPGHTGHTNVKISKLTLSSDGRNMTMQSVNQVVASGKVMSHTTDPDVQYTRVHVQSANARK